ncbi:MAG: hypothetical protein DMF85_06860 [Acidobacteria bacterium]|nr:MAG: hypothetical protein DMF85_06860 [Acidobacteriota bacterium]
MVNWRFAPVAAALCFAGYVFVYTHHLAWPPIRSDGYSTVHRSATFASAAEGVPTRRPRATRRRSPRLSFLLRRRLCVNRA